MSEKVGETISETIRIGISACLLGQAVRWDGGDKRSELCAGGLPREFELLPLCPEVGIGLGVPRQPIRLVGDAADPRALGVEDPGFDVSERLRDFARARSAQLASLDGYIFIKGSPSCGLHSVKLFDGEGRVHGGHGRGIYAAEVCRRFPLLPVEEAGRLEQDTRLRDSFLARVRASHGWRTVALSGFEPGDWLRFHQRHAVGLPMSEQDILQCLLDRAGQAARGREAMARQYYRQLQRALRADRAVCV